MKYILFIFILIAFFCETAAQKSIVWGPEIQLRYNRFYQAQRFEWADGGVFRPAAGVRVAIPISESWKLFTGLQLTFAGQKVYDSVNEFTAGRIPLLLHWQLPIKKGSRWCYLFRAGATGEYLAKVTRKENGANTDITALTPPFFISATGETGVLLNFSSGKACSLTLGSDLGLYGSIPAYPSGNQGPTFKQSSVFLAVSWLFSKSIIPKQPSHE